MIIDALVFGRRKWWLYPPGSNAHGPGLTTIPEWIQRTKQGRLRPLEFVQQEGDIIFIPDGWRHAFLNLQMSVGISIHFASDEEAWKHAYGMRTKED